MSYSKNSEIFKFDHESYRFVKNEVEPKFPKVHKVPKIDDEDNNWKKIVGYQSSKTASWVQMAQVAF